MSGVDFNDTTHKVTNPQKATNPQKVYAYLYPDLLKTTADGFKTEYIDTDGKLWGINWEIATINASGDYAAINESAGNMGYNATNLALCKDMADNVMMTISGNVTAGAGTMLNSSTKITATVDSIVSDIQTYGLRGVNINFEPIASLTGTELAGFKDFIAELRSDLDAVDDTLIISWAGQMAWDTDRDTGKPYSDINYTGESDMVGANHLSITITELKRLGIDICEMQCYDQHYDFGLAGFSITSLDQVVDAIWHGQNRAGTGFGVILPTYGIKAPLGDAYSTTTNNMSRTDITTEEPDFYTTATLQNSTGILKKDIDATYQIHAIDQAGVQQYYDLAKSKGVEYIGFWYLGDTPFPKR